MFCKNCGYAVEEEDSFCIKCGQNLKENKINTSYNKNKDYFKDSQQKIITVYGDELLESWKEEDSKFNENRWDFKIGLIGSSLSYCFPTKMRESIIKLSKLSVANLDYYIANKVIGLERILIWMLVLIKTYLVEANPNVEIITEDINKIIDKLLETKE